MVKGNIRTNEIVEEIPILDVIRETVDYGEVTKKGSTWFVPCPNGHEKNHDNCWVMSKKNKCHCESCGSTFDSISYIQAYKGMSFQGAAEYVASFGRGIEAYVDAPVSKEKELSLTNKELDAIGLKPFATAKDITEVQPYKDNEHNMSIYNIDDDGEPDFGWGKAKTVKFKLTDEPNWTKIALDKTAENFKICKRLLGKEKDPQLRKALESRVVELIEIGKKLKRIEKNLEQKKQTSKKVQSRK